MATPLYRFDEVDADLDLMPMAARRALDRSGLKLSLDGWRSLSLEQRQRIIDLGAAAGVDKEAVGEVVVHAQPPATLLEPTPELPATAVPDTVRASFGPCRPISDAVWSALGVLDRYALGKVAERGRPQRLDAAYAELVGHSALSTHVEPGGGVRMVDVGRKPVTERRAVARARVAMSAEAFAQLERATVPKGDVLGAARLAGIMAAKRTPELIPLCHGVALTRVSVSLTLDAAGCAVEIEATAEAVDRTGVEMEAMVAASVAGLTIYDMLKSVDRGMSVGPTRLVAKSGGRSGDYRA